MQLRLAMACILAVITASPPLRAGHERPRETVVLLHGLGRSQLSMLPLAWALERHGFDVVNLSYRSRTVPLEQLAREWLPAELRKIEAARRAAGDVSPYRVHFVTHSMGGILVRLWLREAPGAAHQIGRVVMLAPPNAGSEIADRLGAWFGFRLATGVNGRRLGTGPDALPQALGAWPAGAPSLGVIAGSRSSSLWFNRWLPRPHDGKVSVASTRLPGAADHIVVPRSHTWIASARETASHVTAFLRDGHFRHADATSRRSGCAPLAAFGP